MIGPVGMRQEAAHLGSDQKAFAKFDGIGRIDTRNVSLLEIRLAVAEQRVKNRLERARSRSSTDEADRS